ncbi:MAG: gamma-glutamylcyclotransferase [Candidatus Aminicenantes bacterium]|nr:gamma-glutamylcyclotransferase [Candidatus Aminicenantes bacterium]
MITKAISFDRALLVLSLGLTLLLIGTPDSAANGKRLLEIPKGFAGVVAYGSLISLPSMEQTLGQKYEGPVHKVHLAGYERVWTCVRPFNSPQAASLGAMKIEAYLIQSAERIPVLGTAELNIYPKKGSRINGVLYLLTEEELRKTDQRERGYQRTDVTNKIEEFRFRGGRVYVYESPSESPQTPSKENGTYVLIKEFLDLVIGACDAQGKDFRREFDKSTRPCTYPIVSFKDITWDKSK